MAVTPPLDPYAALFSAYVEELRTARNVALEWWDALLHREIVISADVASAERAVRMRWPLGPVSHPRVIAVYRKYYLQVDAINREELEDDEATRAHPLDPEAWSSDESQEEPLFQLPKTVLYERLNEADDTLARFLDSLIFIPIGSDRDGRLI